VRGGGEGGGGGGVAVAPEAFIGCPLGGLSIKLTKGMIPPSAFARYEDRVCFLLNWRRGVHH